MDELVRQALAKWPDVPDCYGWLALDARGAFRMRDRVAQASHAPGEVIRHAALLSFIYRNYACDKHGAWFFQNGPQRVFVQLTTTPFIARTDPLHGFITHDGEPLSRLEEVWLTLDGRLILRAAERIAMVDDRDLATCLPMLRVGGQPIDDSALLQWLARPTVELQFANGSSVLPVARVQHQNLGAVLGFEPNPSAKE